MTFLISVLLVASLVVLVATAAVGLGVALLGTGRTAAAATGAGSIALPRAGHWLGGRLVTSLVGAFVLMAAAVVLRAVLVGHAPWSNLHEFSIAFAAATLGIYLVLARAHPIAGLAPVIGLIAAGLVAFALALESRADPLVPALQQPFLLTVHVGSAALAYAVAAVAFAAAVAEIAQRASGDSIELLPSAAVARTVGHRAVLIGFPILTIAIALGSVWANLAWRSYWSNDPKELAAAATWLVFGAYLHVAGRRDRWQHVAPWLIVAGFLGVLFTYVGAGLFIVGEHSYGGA